VLSTMLKPSVTGRIRCSHLEENVGRQDEVIARLHNFLGRLVVLNFRIGWARAHFFRRLNQFLGPEDEPDGL